MHAFHQPVLLQPSIEALNIEVGKTYLDATFGRGGHTREIIARGGNVIATDVDQDAIDWGTQVFANEIQNHSLQLFRTNFSELTQQLPSATKVHGVLFDFGTSVDQLKDANRGFSFEGNAELDMRMDDRLGVKAKDLLAVLSEKQLTNLFQEYGGEESSRAIAKAIVTDRITQPIVTTDQLVQIILRKKQRKGKLHPATKVFQALRMAVNMELESIREGLSQALSLLIPGGRMVTISFHEGEDRIVKHQFRLWEAAQLGIVLTKRSVEPTEEEVAENPRARSAKMRVFEKKK
jgi:16S rRNA (cytosine1402-N4)-methyltransferase